ncbi:MAG: T9SS type A sorting domain-containing protein [Bacteroidales bacterium]|nr:T9SS type A sorting domain-containing protein [Bacteroidales bacterium]
MRKFLLFVLSFVAVNICAQELDWSGAEFDNINLKVGTKDKGTSIKGVKFTDETVTGSTDKHFFIRLDKAGLDRSETDATILPSNYLTIEKSDKSTTSVNGSGLQIRYKSLYKYEFMFRFKDVDGYKYEKVVSFPATADQFVNLTIDMAKMPLQGTTDQFCDFSDLVEILNFTMVFEPKYMDDAVLVDADNDIWTSVQYNQVTGKKEFMVASLKAGASIPTAIGDVKANKALISKVVTNYSSCELYFNEATPKTISVYTLTGSQVKAFNTNDKVLNMNLPTGMYIVAVREGGVQETRKILCK